LSTYNETMEYLHSQLPMYQNVGSSAIKKDLTNIRELCRRLGNPEEKFKVIHVAGTNGKGSVSHLMAAALQANGLKTGLITSPHLIDFRERTRVNGKLVPEEYVIEFTERVKNEIANLKPSFFEIGVALGFQYMADQQVDVAVVETGLGGRLDSTNVVDPLLSIITNISYDHKDHLGYTLPEIAFEKAGIIKPNKPVLIGRNQSEVNHVFLSKANETGSPIHWAYEFMEETWHNANGSSLSCNYSTKNYGEIRVRCDLPGIYQIENIATVLSACIILKDQLHLSLEKCVDGLQDVKTSTGLRGRWDILSQKPLIVAVIIWRLFRIKMK